jgi:2-dehydropantoate 2-reductase
MTKFLIVGAGKLAKHLNHYLSLLELHPLNWDRSQDPHLLKTKIAEASHVLLAISDSAIENFYRKNLAGLDKTVVHFSGALNIPEVIAAHPLMTFGPELYDRDTYFRIHFVLTGVAALNEALPGLPNDFSVLAPEHKALYHALCVMGGNFPVILWQKMFADFERLGISREAARVYLETVLHNTMKSPQTALTGPLARRDKATVLKNIEALENDPFQEVYFTFANIVAPDLLGEKERNP